MGDLRSNACIGINYHLENDSTFADNKMAILREKHDFLVDENPKTTTHRYVV